MDRPVTKTILYGPKLRRQYMDRSSPNKYYMDRSFWGPYNIFGVSVFYYTRAALSFMKKGNIHKYYTLRFYFPYLPLLAQPVNITFSIRFRNGTCIIIFIIICYQIFYDLLLKSAFERIFNVMQLILVNIKWKYLIPKFHNICLSYYFNRACTALFSWWK
jgi:hypothetical protein